jgi:YD repeat-containing protein
LTKTSSGYTRTLANGTQITFDSSGNQTATIDLNGLHTTYSYSSGLLNSIQDPYGNLTTLSYSSGKLSSIQDPAGRLTTFTFTGNNLTAVQQADGSRVTYTYDSAGRMTQRQDPLSHTTSIVYDQAYAYCSPCRERYRSPAPTPMLGRRTDNTILQTTEYQGLFMFPPFARLRVAA